MKNKKIIKSLLLSCFAFVLFFVLFFNLKTTSVIFAADVTIHGYTYDANCVTTGNIPLNLAGTDFSSDTNGYFSYTFAGGVGTRGQGLSAQYADGPAKQFIVQSDNPDDWPLINLDSGDYEAYCNPKGCYIATLGSDTVSSECSVNDTGYQCGYSMDVQIDNSSTWGTIEFGKQYALTAVVYDIYGNPVTLANDKTNNYMTIDASQGVKWNFTAWSITTGQSMTSDSAEFREYFQIIFDSNSLYGQKVLIRAVNPRAARYTLSATASVYFTSYNCGQPVTSGGVNVSVNNKDMWKNTVSNFIGKAYAANTVNWYSVEKSGNYTAIGSTNEDLSCNNVNNYGKFVASVSCTDGEYYAGDPVSSAISTSGYYCPGASPDLSTGTFGASSCGGTSTTCGTNACTAGTRPSTFNYCGSINGCSTDFSLTRCATINSGSQSMCSPWCVSTTLPSCSVQYYAKTGVALSKKIDIEVANPILNVDRATMAFDKCIDNDNAATSQDGNTFTIGNYEGEGLEYSCPTMKAIFANYDEVKDKIEITNMESERVFASAIAQGKNHRLTFTVNPKTSYLNSHKPSSYDFTEEFARIVIVGVHTQDESVHAINSAKEIKIYINYKQCDGPKVTCAVTPTNGTANEQNFVWTAKMSACPNGVAPRFQWFENLSCQGSGLLNIWAADATTNKIYDTAGTKGAYVRADCGDGSQMATSTCCKAIVQEKGKPTCSITSSSCVKKDTEFDLSYTTYNSISAIVNPGNLSAETGTSKTIHITNKINSATNYTMNVTDSTGLTGSCSVTVNPQDNCDATRNLQGVFIAGKIDDRTGDQKVNITQDSHVINNPPPGFNDLFAPIWQELVP